MKIYLVKTDVGSSHEMDAVLAICSSPELAAIEAEQLRSRGWVLGEIIEWEVDKSGLEALL